MYINIYYIHIYVCLYGSRCCYTSICVCTFIEDLMHGMVTDGDRWCEESGFQSQQDHGHA